MVLEKMTNVAKDRLYVDKITDVVITVPAHFNNNQKMATKRAGELAGLKVLRILNEPTAAAIAYGLEVKHHRQSTEKKYVLVYDLGGGTFDVTILIIEECNFDVLTTHGDSHLGGSDFDNNLVKYCADEFKSKHQVEVQNNQAAMVRLRKAVETAKHTLSNASSASIKLEYLIGNFHMDMKITRAR